MTVNGMPLCSSKDRHKRNTLCFINKITTFFPPSRRFPSGLKCTVGDSFVTKMERGSFTPKIILLRRHYFLPPEQADYFGLI